MNKKLTCQECEKQEEIPQHCGKPMHIEKIDDREMLVCWMGSSCGVRDLPNHHDKPMRIT